MNTTVIAQKTQQSIAAILAGRGLEIIESGHAVAFDAFRSEVMRDVYFVERHDFLGDALGQLCGAVPANLGYFVVCGTLACLQDELGRAGAEQGWRRWRLPSADGLCRQNDRNAPSVFLSPSGALFWRVNDRKEAQRVSFVQLIDLAHDHYLAVAVSEEVAA